jgi:Leucine-rich repeat (LRR) protein
MDRADRCEGDEVEFCCPARGEAVCAPRGAEQLDLSGCGLPEIPEQISELGRLREVDLSRNWLRRLERRSPLRDLEYLETADLSHNEIEEIEGGWSPAGLRELDLRDNRIETTKTGMGDLAELRYLNLAQNSLSELEGLAWLKELEELVLSENRLASMKGMWGLRSLRRVDLRDNEIEAVPVLKILRDLEEADLRRNPVKRIERLDRPGELSWLLLRGGESPEDLPRTTVIRL